MKSLVGLVAGCVLCVAQTYTNPLFKGQDPYVTFWNGNYYYSDAGGGRIQIRKSTSLTGLPKQTPYLVWTNAGTHITRVWAPELHQIDDRWYVYFSADIDSNNQHRLYVAQGGSDPLDSYGAAVLLTDSTNRWAIDPDVFTAADGQLYITWSCTNDLTGTAPQSICLARMSDPQHIASATVKIATPTEPWETRTAPIEEGPVGFVHQGITYITFSGSASWTNNDYSVGVLIAKSGDLLDPQSWVKRGPIFDHHGRAYGPGSVIFVPSPDGTELWSLYHAYDNVTCAPWSCRSIRLQKVHWDDDGTPSLGYPVDPQVPAWAPSGDVSSTGWGDSRLGAQASGTWLYSSASNLDTTAAFAGELRQSFRADPSLLTYSVSTAVQPGSATGILGLYASYTDEGNHAGGFIDLDAHAFISAAIVNGAVQPWSAHSLPAGFDAATPHTIRIDKAADGEFSYFLDGTAIDDRRFPLALGQVGVFSSSPSASFRDVALVDTSHGWGDASGDAAQGWARDGGMGFVHGAWQPVDAANVISTETGSGWHAIYRGNPNYSSSTASVTATLLNTGSTVEHPGYGMLACYDDRNNNVSFWVRPAAGTLELNIMVQGQPRSRTANLPPDFDPAQPHKLDSEKMGSNFVFWLDGIEVFRETIALANGMAGLVTEDASVDFRSFTFSPR
jgi:GH43 family beta-xylosidase